MARPWYSRIEVRGLTRRDDVDWDAIEAPPDIVTDERINMEDMLRYLHHRERRVIELRNGLGDADGCHTLEQVARIFGLSRERIRQIEARGIRKLHVRAFREGHIKK